MSQTPMAIVMTDEILEFYLPYLQLNGCGGFAEGLLPSMPATAGLFFNEHC